MFQSIKSSLISLVILFGIQSGPYAQNAEIIRLSDFGARSNSFLNAAPAIQKAIRACKSKSNATLLLPGGRIDIWPDGAVKRELYVSNSTEDDKQPKLKNIAFFLENCKNLTIYGNNTLVILHGKMVSFAIFNSTNIQLRNISFDYERPTMSELTIRSVASKAVEVDISDIRSR